MLRSLDCPSFISLGVPLLVTRCLILCRICFPLSDYSVGLAFLNGFLLESVGEQQLPNLRVEPFIQLIPNAVSLVDSTFYFRDSPEDPELFSFKSYTFEILFFFSFQNGILFLFHSRGGEDRKPSGMRSEAF